MKRYLLVTAAMFAACFGTSLATAQGDEAPEEIVVTGRLPGPPLWKISNGDKVLWIFPYLDWIPKDMIWENERVARVIAQSQEILGLPLVSLMVSPLVRLNPVNVARNERLNKRLDRIPDGGTLQQNLPPALYARFSAVRERYWPGSKDAQAKVRPQRAGRAMMNAVQKREGLVSGDDILTKIQHLVRRNRDIKRIEILVSTEIDDFDEYADRAEAVWKSLPPEQEQACFEQQVRHMEEDLGKMKSRANSWAQGYIDEFRNVPLVFDESNACNDLVVGSSSPEQETVVGMQTRMNQMWLDAADNALATNASTFAILPINELLADGGLLSKLRAKGYDVSEP